MGPNKHLKKISKHVNETFRKAKTKTVNDILGIRNKY